MIEFTCPGCLSQCVANGVFSGMRARCVVCGAFIRIPTDTGEVAFPLGALPAGPLPDRKPKAVATSARPPKPSVRPKSESGLVVLPDPDADAPRIEPAEHPDDTLETERVGEHAVIPLAAEEPAPARAAAKKAAKPAAKKKPAKLTAADDELVWEDSEDETPRPEALPREARSEPAAKDPAKARKRRYMIIGGSVAASVVIALVLGLSGGEKPKLPSTPPTADIPEPPPPPPKKEEKKPEVMKEPVVIEVAPAPRAADNAATFVAAQLVAERAANPAAFDAANRGRLFFLRGTYARTVGGAFYLAEGTDDERGITCAPPQITKKPSAEPPPEAGSLQPGQAVLVRGWYAGDLRLTDCRIVGTSGPADDDYRDKVIEVAGLVGTVNPVDPESTDRFPVIVLEPASTDCPVSVRCLFRVTEREKLTTLKPGRAVTVRGKCEGRSFRVVRLHDCALVPSGDPPVPGVVRVPAERFFAAYEVDLLHYERPGPTVPPITVTAEQLAAAFSADPRQANAAYQYKSVQVTGKVVSRIAGAITLETGTSHKYQVQARFTPSRFATVKEFPTLTIRGTCAGVSGKFVRVENGEAVDPEAGNGAIRITPDYFPLQQGRELVYDLLTPTGTRDNPVTRLGVRFAEADVLRVTPIRHGTLAKPSLFADPPGTVKWSTNRPKAVPHTTELRLNEDTIEMRERPAPPLQPAAWWDPILKIGVRKGETWSSTMPDGRVVTYIVVRFGKDYAERNTVEIQRVLKNPKETATWDETTLTYARGVGEVRRVMTKQSTNGKAYLTLEMKWVEGEVPPGGSEPKKEAELKKDDKKNPK
jgi:hypothetical protein